MRVAICDDQPELLVDLKNKIQKLDSISEIETFSDVKDVFRAIKEKKLHDIIFMNIELGKGINGIDAVSNLGNLPVNVVFVTAYPARYAETIFNGKVNPAGFLIKPVNEEQLGILVKKIVESKNEEKKTVSFSVNGKSLVFHVNEINYCEGRLHKMAIHFVNGEEVEISQSLNESKSVLPEKFIEVHKSYIVNPDNVSEFSSNNVIMSNGEVVPASRSRGSSAKQRFLKYIAEKA